VDDQLRTMIDLQGLDTRIAALEAEVARLPGAIAAARTAVEEARKTVETAKSRLDGTKKETRTREKDLEVAQAKRARIEARLYEVKTNKEYSAVLLEIEEVKQEKSRIEEETLTLMERQERLVAEIKEAESRLEVRAIEGGKEEAALTAKLRELEADLALLRGERRDLTSQLPPLVLANYDKLLRARGGLALVPIIKPNLCAGCRMTVTPQRIQELRHQNALIPCESCGRFLYWLP
jgi:predicted  nucleic acid-binding Zn-ribbon protein